MGSAKSSASFRAEGSQPGASPRVADTPRSVLSTPRSVLSAATPRSVVSAISSTQERWAAQKRAQNDLYDAICGSVHRDELSQLTRGQLRFRLRELGSAKTEGEGLLHGQLVDNVIVWNALARMKDRDSAKQHSALKALQDPTLPADLLTKALLVTGVPVEEAMGLKQKEASERLQQRLEQFLARQAQAAEPADAAELVEGPRDWEEDEPEHGNPQLELEVIDEDEEEPRDDLQDAGSAPVDMMDAAQEAREAKFDALDTDLSQCADMPPLAAAQGLARDAKFDQIDSDLAQSLRSMEETPLARAGFHASEATLPPGPPLRARAPMRAAADPELPPLELGSGPAGLGGAIDTFIVHSARRGKHSARKDSARNSAPVPDRQSRV